MESTVLGRTVCSQTQCLIHCREFCSSRNCKPSKFSCIYSTVHIVVYSPASLYKGLFGGQQQQQEITSELLPGCLISFASAAISITAPFCLPAAAALNNWKNSSASSHGGAPRGIFALHMFVQHTHTHTLIYSLCPSPILYFPLVYSILYV